MKREVSRRVRDRYLTPEEGAKYRALRAQIEAEKPEILARLRSQLKVTAPGRVFERLREIREAQGLSLGDLELRTGIEAAVLSRLESGEQEDFSVGTAERYAEALGKHLTFGIWDAGSSPTQSGLGR